MLNAKRFEKFHGFAAAAAAALFFLASPAHASGSAAADAGITAPDDDLDTYVAPGQSTTLDAGEASAVFQAWRQLDTGLAASSAVAVPSRKPIDAMKLSSSYGMRVHPVTGRLARHNGIDIPAPHGTPILATADGIVGRAQRLGGYGLYVEVEHGNAIQTRFGHMSSIAVRPGQMVKQGEVLGYVGSTGRSTGNHLHYEVRIEGTPVNPLPFVQGGEMALAALSGDGKVAMGGPE